MNECAVKEVFDVILAVIESILVVFTDVGAVEFGVQGNTNSRTKDWETCFVKRRMCGPVHGIVDE